MLGALVGVLCGLLIVLAGAAFLLLVILVIPAGFVAARSLAYLSGTFLGLVAAWLALPLLPRADGWAWTSTATAGYIVIAAVLLIAGMGAGILAHRRWERTRRTA